MSIEKHMSPEQRQVVEEIVRWLRFGPPWVQQQDKRGEPIGGDPRVRNGLLWLIANMIEKRWLT